MLINTLTASITFRRSEFAQVRLAGAHPAQVLRTVRTEGLPVMATGRPS